MNRRTSIIVLPATLVLLVWAGIGAMTQPQAAAPTTEPSLGAAGVGLLAGAARVQASVDVPLLEAPADLLRGADDPAWPQAAAVSHFMDSRGRAGEPTDAATSFRIFRTGTHLFLLVRCDERQMNQVVAKATRQDGHVYDDDSIEIFLMPTREFGRYFHLIANTAAVRYDTRVDPSQEDVDFAWTCDWKVHVTRREPRDGRAGGFDYAVSIPLAAIGPVEEGGSWRFNIGRNRPGRGASAWCATFGSFHTPRLFGHARFVPALTAGLDSGWARSLNGRTLPAKALIECEADGRRSSFWWQGTLPADGSVVSVLDAATTAASRRVLFGTGAAALGSAQSGPATAPAPADGSVRVTLFDAQSMRVLGMEQWRPPL